jgi:hypothetical protein
MFDHHKKHPWFIEKYEPSEYYVNLRKRVRKQGWRGKATQFLLELEEGKFDNDILPLEESIEPSGEESPSKISPETKSEPPKPADVKNGTHEEDMSFGLDAEEDQDHENKIEAGSKSTLDAKVSSRNDEISVMPEGNEILIRTLPPDISRVKLEEVSTNNIPLYSVIHIPCKGLLKHTWLCSLGTGRSFAKKTFLSGGLD